jgi:RNA polymerase sigma factor (sigma-70 family)
LRQFIVQHDEGAFTELLRRHGPMVLDAARCVLHNRHDAEDVYQATFLVLAQKAPSIRKQTSLASWLYGVAYRLAMKARTSAAKRHTREAQKTSEVSQTSEVLRHSVMDEMTWRELRLILHEELHRLPDKFRSPLLLCYFEGKTQDEAAEQLGWNKWTLKDRLDQARDLLRRRLTRRGVIPSAALFASLLAREAASAVPATLLDSLAHACSLLAAGQPTAGAVSAQAVQLGAQAIRSMAFTQAKLAVGMVLVFGMIAASAGLATYHASKDDPPQEKKVPRLNLVAMGEIPARPPQKNQPRTDAYGDPLPPGAIARLGTTRFRHGAAVYSVTFSPDGKTIASGSNDSTVRLWDTATGLELRRFQENGVVTSVKFSPNGKILAAGGQSGTIALFDTTTATLLRRFDQRQCVIETVSFSPDGKMLASACTDQSIRLWDAATGKELRQFTGHLERLSCVAFSPDGKTLASTAYDSTVRLWEVATGKEQRTLKMDMPAAVAFSPDGKTLVAGGRERAVIMWTTATGQELRRFLGHKDSVTGLAFSPDGGTLAASGQDRSIRLWHVGTGKQLRQLQAHPPASERGHQLEVCCVAFSPDGKILVSGGMDHTIRLWETATGKEIRPLTGHEGLVACIAFSPDRKTLVTGGYDHTIRFWEMPTGKQIAELQGGRNCWIASLAFSPGGETLASGGADVRIWETASRKEVYKFQQNESNIERIHFIRDGSILAAGIFNNKIVVWDVHKGQKVCSMGENGLIYAVAFSPDGKYLASGGADQLIYLWEVNSGKEIRRFTGHDVFVESLAYSPDGTVLASADQRAVVRLWDVATGKEISRLAIPQGGINRLVFSPDARYLAGSAHRGDTIFLWEMASRKECMRFMGHKNWHKCFLAFSPDGRTLASGTDDTTAMLWDMTGRSPEGTLASIDLPPKGLDTLWKDLAGEDAQKAFRAIWTLVAGSKQAIPFLRKHLEPVPPIDAKSQQQVDQWLAGLDNREFHVRDKATKELEKLGERGGDAIRQALKGNPSLEVRRKLEQLLEKLERFPSAPERLREVRAVEVLEHIGTAEATQHLQALAVGAPEARLTKEAKASVDRLAKRASTN